MKPENECNECLEVASAGEPPYLREFQVQKDNKTYIIKVTHAGYLQELKLRNANRPKTAKIDENILILEDIDEKQLGEMDQEQVCQRFSQTPFEILQPYLTEQEVTN